MSVFISSSKSHGKRNVSQSAPWFAWRRLLSSMKANGPPISLPGLDSLGVLTQLFRSIYLMYLLLCSHGCLHNRPVEVRRGHRSSWNWSYGWCYVGYDMWVLGTKSGSPAGTSAPKHRATSSGVPSLKYLLRDCRVWELMVQSETWRENETWGIPVFKDNGWSHGEYGNSLGRDERGCWDEPKCLFKKWI